VKKAVCVHEEDAGICWKHTEYRDGHAEVRRNRRLVMSFIATGAPCRLSADRKTSHIICLWDLVAAVLKVNENILSASGLLGKGYELQSLQETMRQPS